MNAYYGGDGTPLTLADWAARTAQGALCHHLYELVHPPGAAPVLCCLFCEKRLR